MNRFEDWYAGNASDDERKRMFEKNQEGSYKLMGVLVSEKAFIAGMNGWISIKDRQPEHGQEIVGFAYCNEGEPGAHGVWDEVWDKDEPIGAMTHWMPQPDKP